MATLRQVVTTNPYFRNVLQTTPNEQLVAMTLQPRENIGWEVHPQDQFFYVESGTGLAIINNNRYHLIPGSGIIIPGGASHNIFNVSRKQPLSIFVIYSPPKHPLFEKQKRKDE